MTRISGLLSTILLTLFFAVGANAQMVEDPAVWKFEAKKLDGNKYDLIFHCDVKNGYHIYSLDPGGDGSFLPPEFNIKKNADIKLVGKLREKGKKIDETIEDIGTIHYYKNVDYIQTVELAKEDMLITGEYMYMVCNDQGCLPPKTKDFSIKIGNGNAGEKKNDTVATVVDTAASVLDTNVLTTGTNTNEVAKNKISDTDKKGAGTDKSLLWLFLAALAGGVLAVLTPCVYAMIPITVSFFTKRSKTRAEGIRNAFMYSGSIIFIFTVLGILISVVFGANALNNLSTNWIANLIFFIIFIVFGISFLGAFEITLPSSWTSKTDSKAGLTSFGGIFFMALTLVIVSFSCTGPIVGPLLVQSVQGGIAGPAVGMLGFSIGLAMPFALFAVFPGMLNKLAQSGGWLNQVKVVLGFLELMLAMKFLSNADLAMGWRLLDREVFIAIWIVLSVLLGIYLLGKLKLSHDDAPAKNIYGQEYVSIFKLFLAIISFTFAVYLVPGMWGAPLNGMSQFLPPMGTFDQFGGGGNNTGGHGSDVGGIKPVKYVDEMKIYEPPVVIQAGLVTFFDYNEALEAGKKLNKPVMLDFTGINCVNCRKMESQVWSKPEVMKRLKEDFVVASLYCDYDKISLPASEQFFSDKLNAQVKTLGDWNEHLQAEKFNANTQPFYFFVDSEGNKLIDKGYGYDPNVKAFIDHLDKVKENFKNGVRE